MKHFWLNLGIFWTSLATGVAVVLLLQWAYNTSLSDWRLWGTAIIGSTSVYLLLQYLFSWEARAQRALKREETSLEELLTVRREWQNLHRHLAELTLWREKTPKEGEGTKPSEQIQTLLQEQKQWDQSLEELERKLYVFFLNLSISSAATGQESLSLLAEEAQRLWKTVHELRQSSTSEFVDTVKALEDHLKIQYQTLKEWQHLWEDFWSQTAWGELTSNQKGLLTTSQKELSQEEKV